MEKKIFWLASISLFLLLCISGTQANTSNVTLVEEKYSTAQETTDAASSGNIEADQTIARSFQENLTRTIQGGHQMLQLSSGSNSNSASFSRHIMCKGHDVYWNGSTFVWDPIDPTTIFSPSDPIAECLTTVTINETIEFRWYYRNDSSKTWVSCYNWTGNATVGYHEYHFASWLNISSARGSYYPRAYKVEVYLDGSPTPAFSEFCEITNGGLNSPRMCEDVQDGQPVNMKSRFTIGNDMKAHHYLRFDKIAYFNDELNCSHNFTTVWIQPNGSTYKTYSGSFPDYKDTNVTWNYWEYNYTQDDYIDINPSTPVGNWKVKVYLDSYYSNNTWIPYGPIATTPFIVGNETVADWTFMVYLDADNTLERPGIEIFEKMASVNSSSQINIVVQMDRHPDHNKTLGYDDRYGNWTDCKRFNVTKGMTPTPENAIMNLTEVNMGDPNTLKDFVDWTINNYPANYYFLVLWDHGTGFVGVCYDLTNATDALSLPELSQALSGLPAIMDVVFLDACSMSMTEVAYQIKDYANVLVGPEGIGYAMAAGRAAPYDEYLESLTSNPSMSPSAFTTKVVTEFIDWCNDIDVIHNATMSATDLTKITSLMAAIDDFALKLKEKETPYLSLLLASHEQIILARNLTAGYTGPYGDQSGYYIDLYHFAQLINQSVLDEELRNTADQVMTTLESIIIIEDDKDRPDSHGLSIFFPDEEGKYKAYESWYEETTFAEDTPWDEFVKYHLSGYVLTIKTPYPDIPVKVDEESYTTDAEGKIRVFILPNNYTVNVTTPVETGVGSREAFVQWNDNNMSNPRTLSVNRTLTLEAEYETQYEVIFSQSGVGTDFKETVVTINETEYNVTGLPVSLWWDNGTTLSFAFQSPLVVTPYAKQYAWNFTSGLSSLKNDSITVSKPSNITGNYKAQYYLTVISPYDTPGGEGWYDNCTTAYATLDTGIVDHLNGTRRVFTHWSGDASGTNYTASAPIYMDGPQTATANWKTQYLVTFAQTGLDATANSIVVTVNDVPKNFSNLPFSEWFDNSSWTVYLYSDIVSSTISGKRFNLTGVTGPDSPIHVTSPATVAGNYKAQYYLTMSTIFGTVNPGTGWHDAGSTVRISASAPDVVDGERYVWLGWTRTGNDSYSSTDNPAFITMNGPVTKTAAWRHEYYFTVTCLYGSPTLESGWFEAGESINTSVTSAVSGPTGTRYVYTGWTGTGSVSASGTTTSVIFTIDEPSSITWNWKTQYLLTVYVDPAGLGPQPNVFPPGPWYDNGMLVTCTAQKISGRVFDHWTVDGASWDPGKKEITINMDGPHEAGAHYERAPTWWEILLSVDMVNIYIGILGFVALPFALVGIEWYKNRRRRGALKALLNEIDEVYSRFKTNPLRCKEELYRLRDKNLEVVADGKITQESYDIMDKRIEKYLEELGKQK